MHNLTGIAESSIRVVDEDGSPSPMKEIVLFNPSKISSSGGWGGNNAFGSYSSSRSNINDDITITTSTTQENNVKFPFIESCSYQSCLVFMLYLHYFNIPTIVFVKSRQVAEKLYSEMIEKIDKNKNGSSSEVFHLNATNTGCSRIACYRGGYTSDERRNIGRFSLL